MSDYIPESTDRALEQMHAGEEQFYPIKKGYVTIEPSDFSGTRAYVEETIYSFSNPSGGALVDQQFTNLAYDVYHYITDADHELGEEQIDAMVVRLPYYRSNSPEGAHGATAMYGWREQVGSSTIKLMIDYKAPAASGSPMAADRTQTFYYIIYTQKPVSS